MRLRRRARAAARAQQSNGALIGQAARMLVKIITSGQKRACGGRKRTGRSHRASSGCTRRMGAKPRLLVVKWSKSGQKVVKQRRWWSKRADRRRTAPLVVDRDFSGQMQMQRLHRAVRRGSGQTARVGPNGRELVENTARAHTRSGRPATRVTEPRLTTSLSVVKPRLYTVLVKPRGRRIRRECPLPAYGFGPGRESRWTTWMVRPKSSGCV